MGAKNFQLRITVSDGVRCVPSQHLTVTKVGMSLSKTPNHEFSPTASALLDSTIVAISLLCAVSSVMAGEQNQIYFLLLVKVMLAVVFSKKSVSCYFVHITCLSLL